MSDDLLIGAILNFESRVGLPWQCIKLGEDKRMKTQRQTERDKRRRRRRILHFTFINSLSRSSCQLFFCHRPISFAEKCRRLDEDFLISRIWEPAAVFSSAQLTAPCHRQKKKRATGLCLPSWCVFWISRYTGKGCSLLRVPLI